MSFSSCLVSGPNAYRALGPFFEKKYMMEVLPREHAFSDTGSLGVDRTRGELDGRPLRRNQGGHPVPQNEALRLKRARNIPRQLV